MKQLIIVFVLMIVWACGPENTTPIVPSASLVDSQLDTTQAQLLKRGMFVGLDGPTSGRASLYEQSGTKYVLLDPFMSHAGPDLYVYISKDADAGDYIRLGKLRAVTGRQVYAIPGNPTVTDYHFVHIWCQAYSVDFARAEVK